MTNNLGTGWLAIKRIGNGHFGLEHSFPPLVLSDKHMEHLREGTVIFSLTPYQSSDAHGSIVTVVHRCSIIAGHDFQTKDLEQRG